MRAWPRVSPENVIFPNTADDNWVPPMAAVVAAVVAVVAAVDDVVVAVTETVDGDTLERRG